MSWASDSTTPMLCLESQFLIRCSWALSEACSLMRAHMKSYITTSFKCGFSNSLILLTTFLYHEALMDLSLGQTSIHQDSRIKGAPLHPSLFSQSIKGGIITKPGLYNVRENCKGMKQQRIQHNRYKWVWSIKVWVMSNGSWVTGLLNEATTFRFNPLHL